MSSPIEQIRSHLQSANEPFNGFARTADFRDFGRRLDLDLPLDVRDAYSIMNGFEGYTTLDMGWLRLWPLVEWRPVNEEFPDLYPQLQRPWVMFADQGLNALFYAIHLSTEKAVGHVCLIGEETTTVAESFSEFLKLIITDSDRLFGGAI